MNEMESELTTLKRLVEFLLDQGVETQKQVLEIAEYLKNQKDCEPYISELEKIILANKEDLRAAFLECANEETDISPTPSGIITDEEHINCLEAYINEEIKFMELHRGKTVHTIKLPLSDFVFYKEYIIKSYKRHIGRDITEFNIPHTAYKVGIKFFN